ncbi:MAG: DUF3667 domain-containing protein [Bacteroidales bacterium]|nr:DUF3667 domain-containing protein [Bacteroidales bacterium]
MKSLLPDKRRSAGRRKHPFEVRRRAFSLWQHLGFNPWPKPAEEGKGKAREKSGSGDFYKGAFDSIPFLNQDAKRTFQHLLLRPGYMIRDYINGQHERYLAPLTALIVFYAFFALISAVLQPVQHRDSLPGLTNEDNLSEYWKQDTTHNIRISHNVARIVQKGYLFLHLDQYPEAVDTQHEAAIAALESTLRSQGIPLFLSEFLFLWIAMLISLRSYRLGKGACAAASAYVLCQFSFFMLFALLLTWGKSTSISVFLMLFLLMVDYHQWLGIPWKKSFWQAVRTGVCYGIVYGLMILCVSALVLVAAFFKR